MIASTSSESDIERVERAGTKVLKSWLSVSLLQNFKLVCGEA
jgi:hypothetical protein